MKYVSTLFYRDVLEWLVEQKDNDEIEEVTDEILDKLIETNSAIIAVFCKIFELKWVPENMYTFSIAGHIVNVYKFSGTHFNSIWKFSTKFTLQNLLTFLNSLFKIHFPKSLF